MRCVALRACVCALRACVCARACVCVCMDAASQLVPDLCVARLMLCGVLTALLFLAPAPIVFVASLVLPRHPVPSFPSSGPSTTSGPSSSPQRTGTASSSQTTAARCRSTSPTTTQSTPFLYNGWTVETVRESPEFTKTLLSNLKAPVLPLYCALPCPCGANLQALEFERAYPAPCCTTGHISSTLESTAA